MPYFSFSINQINSSLTKFNIIANKVYFSKNTQLWKLLNKGNNSIINFLKREKRVPISNIKKNILFCLPPSIGLGDAIEYAYAINEVRSHNICSKIGIAFTDEFSFLFKDFFKLDNIYPFIIKKTEIDKFDTVFHLTLEIKSLTNQKYYRSNICEEILKFFNIKKNKNKKILINKKTKINKISIFPLSNSPIRTMPVIILNKLILLLKKNFDLEIFLDSNSSLSNFLYKNINFKNLKIIDPKDKLDLVKLIKNIEYGLFMDSGPLHVAKLFNKRGVLIESSVSEHILLDDYNLIKSIENNYSSAFCRAPCGLTDIFNHNNNFGCYDSLEIQYSKFKSNNYKNLTNRGVKNYYTEIIRKPVGCLSSLNVQNIYNAIKKDLLL